MDGSSSHALFLNVWQVVKLWTQPVSKISNQFKVPALIYKATNGPRAGSRDQLCTGSSQMLGKLKAVKLKIQGTKSQSICGWRGWGLWAQSCPVVSFCLWLLHPASLGLPFPIPKHQVLLFATQAPTQHCRASHALEFLREAGALLLGASYRSSQKLGWSLLKLEVEWTQLPHETYIVVPVRQKAGQSCTS